MRLAATLLAFALATAAQAQTPDAVKEHYSAYQTALDAGDFPLAETEAEATLAAAHAAGRGPKSIAVLALNLAIVRLDQGKLAQAYEPAALANDAIAKLGAASGVDPLMARLVLARADVARGEHADYKRAQMAIVEADARADLNEYLFPAAYDLGDWAMTNDEIGVAQTAYAIAVRHTDGAFENPDFVRGQARFAQGVAFLYGNRTKDAYRAFRESSDIFAKLLEKADRKNPPLVLSNAFVTAAAWSSATDAKLGQLDAKYETPPELKLAEPICEAVANAQPQPKYPTAALKESGVGVVVLRLKLNDKGEIVSHEIATAVPSKVFADAVRKVFDSWTFKLKDPAAPQCAGERTIYTRVSFRLD